jgi:NAD(P)-dependent dehydrogenase (short-subunit alcohol dehydrogenase family)
MLQRNYGRVVNVSSGGGSFGEGLGPAPYAVSTAALNALTVKVAQVVQGTVKLTAMCPEWISTDMGEPARRARPRRPWIPWFSSRPLRKTDPAADFSGTESLSLSKG